MFNTNNAFVIEKVIYNFTSNYISHLFKITELIELLDMIYFVLFP